MRNSLSLTGVSGQSDRGGRAEETPIGYVPEQSALWGKGLDVSADALKELLRVDRDAWRANLRSQAEFFERFGDRLPAGLREEHAALDRRLKAR